MSKKSDLSHNDKKHKSIRLEKINKSFPGVNFFMLLWVAFPGDLFHFGTDFDQPLDVQVRK